MSLKTRPLLWTVCSLPVVAYRCSVTSSTSTFSPRNVAINWDNRIHLFLRSNSLEKIRMHSAESLSGRASGLKHRLGTVCRII